MDGVDLAAAWRYTVALALRAGIVVIFLSSLDDLLVDLRYWWWRLRCLLQRRDWRRTAGLPADAGELYADAQQPIAIMLPAWHEAAVIERMVNHAVRMFDYDPQRWHLFIGTYPNDPETQREVDRVAATHPNVHKVVTERDGPTSKADCLNHIVAGIAAFEAAHGVHFPCLVYHDAEDVVHPLELRVFNRLVPAYDLVQLPVLPLVRPLGHAIGNHYVDEFAEWHGKDLLVRGLLTGQIPSAGVGTAFSREAIAMLADANGGRAFDDQSLTEDYEIGLRLHEMGARQVLVHYPVRFAGTPPEWMGHAGAHREVCVQEYFPASYDAAVRQKSRWITGIVFQGWRRLGWRGGLAMRWMLLRDRKSVVAFPAVLLGYVIVAAVLVEWAHRWLNPDWWAFPDLIPRDSWLWVLVALNFLMMLNRLLQRFVFTRRHHGLLQGLLSAPRMVVGNLVNVTAFFRALAQFRAASRSGRPVAWDKTSHEFPMLHPEDAAPARGRRP